MRHYLASSMLVMSVTSTGAWQPIITHSLHQSLTSAGARECAHDAGGFSKGAAEGLARAHGHRLWHLWGHEGEPTLALVPVAALKPVMCLLLRLCLL